MALQSNEVVVTGSEDATAKLLSLTSGKVLGTLVGHRSTVEAVGCCDAQPFIATGSDDGRVMLWDAQATVVRQTCEHDAAVTRLQWVGGTCLFYTSATDGNIRLWDARTGKCERKWTGHSDAVLDMWVSPNGKIVCTASDDGTARIFVV